METFLHTYPNTCSSCVGLKYFEIQSLKCLSFREVRPQLVSYTAVFAPCSTSFKLIHSNSMLSAMGLTLEVSHTGNSMYLFMLYIHIFGYMSICYTYNYTIYHIIYKYMDTYISLCIISKHLKFSCESQKSLPRSGWTPRSLAWLQREAPSARSSLCLPSGPLVMTNIAIEPDHL